MSLNINLKFLRSLSIFTGANFINASIPFLLLPVLTQYLSPTDFGVVAMFQVLINIVLPFAGLNVDGAVSRNYFERDSIDFPKYVSNALLILLISSAVVLILFFLFGGGIKDLIFGEESPAIGIWWIPAIVALALGQNLIQVQLNIWQVQQNALQFGILRIARTLTEIGLSVFLIVAMRMSWEGRIGAQFLAVFLFSIASIIFLYRGNLLKRGVSKTYISSALAYGAPLVPHVLSGVIITFSDRLFITNMISLSEAGLYTVGYQVGMVVSLLQSSFNQTWAPWLFEKLKLNEEAVKLRIVKFTYFYYLLMALLVIALALFAPLIYRIFIGKEFSSGVVYVFWIALGFGFNGMYKMVVNYIFYLNKTYLITAVTLFVACLNIALNYILIKSCGAVGAAQATAISFFTEFVLIWALSARLYKMPWLFFLSRK